MKRDWDRFSEPEPQLSKIEVMILLERFVNDGSPTGLTWKNSSSFATCPRKSAKCFLLPLLKVNKEVCSINGSLPPQFIDEQVLFPVHPDCVHLLDPAFHEQLVWDPYRPMLVMPTSSPRTIFCGAAGWNGFVKLDYPFVLGRFPRELNREKLNHGVTVSSLLLQERADEYGVYHFPEIGTLEIQSNSYRHAGALFREGLETGPGFDRYFSFCSLFGSDYFAPQSEPILLELAYHFGGLQWISSSVVQPLLESFWKLVTNFGMWPEPHAQNIVLGVNASGKTGIIWRDGQGFWFDYEMKARDMPGPMNRVLTMEDPERQRRRSFIYDWTLGTYVLDPIIKVSTSRYREALEQLTEVIRNVTLGVLTSIAEELLPPGRAYGMSLAEPQGRHLPLSELEELRFR
jgi:hypothetical protein